MLLPLEAEMVFPEKVMLLPLTVLLHVPSPLKNTAEDAGYPLSLEILSCPVVSPLMLIDETEIVGFPNTPFPFVSEIPVPALIVVGEYVAAPLRARIPVVLSPDRACNSVPKVKLNVPLDVMGDPETVSPVLPVQATDDT